MRRSARSTRKLWSRWVEMSRIEVRFAGFGGQGIIKSGIITAAAASIHAGKNAVQTQSYGPESRGGACKSEVVISEEEIDFPKVVEPEVLVVMSQHAYNDYADDLKACGIVILDPDMIPTERDLKGVKVFRVPATKIADELGRRIVANIVMIGAFVAITNLLDKNAGIESIKAK